MRRFIILCVAVGWTLVKSDSAFGSTAFTCVVVDGQTNILSGPSPSIELSAGATRVDIHYANSDIAAPAQGHFRYRLMGVENDWTDVGSARTVSFTKLPPGRYAFEVETADSTGAWTQSVSTLVVTVEPQVTPRKLAMLFAMLLAVLGIAYFFFFRKDRNEHQMA
jgi:hypothetical protein